MNNIIAYCGLNCNIRICCQGKDDENCTACAEYACEKLEEFFAMAPEAKENLEKVRN